MSSFSSRSTRTASPPPSRSRASQAKPFPRTLNAMRPDEEASTSGKESASSRTMSQSATRLLLGHGRVAEPLRRAEEPRVLDPLAELTALDPLHPDEQDRMSTVVRRLEVAVGRGLDEERKLAGVDADRERSFRCIVGAHPGEESALDLERGLSVGRRLLRSGERPGDVADDFPVGHERTIVSPRP